jgi:nucleotide-binding universal stress UspA family protein
VYRHLLVPLDASRLASEIVRQSILLARSLGAKVTFMHALTSGEHTSLDALERVMWPTLDTVRPDSGGLAVLADAGAAARESKVEYDVLCVPSDRPHDAILQAAEKCDCDLIVMASHGRRGIAGLLTGSQTRNVLQLATLPVLVIVAHDDAGGHAA